MCTSTASLRLSNVMAPVFVKNYYSNPRFIFNIIKEGSIIIIFIYHFLIGYKGNQLMCERDRYRFQCLASGYVFYITVSKDIEPDNFILWITVKIKGALYCYTIYYMPGNHMMSNGDPSLGDSADNMGIQNIDACNLENAFTKGKEYVNHIQPLKNPDDDLCNDTDIDSIKGIYKALKTTPNNILTKVEIDTNFLVPNNISNENHDNSGQEHVQVEHPTIEDGLFNLTTFDQNLLSHVNDITITTIDTDDTLTLSRGDVDLDEDQEINYIEECEKRKVRISDIEERINACIKNLKQKQMEILNNHAEKEYGYLFKYFDTTSNSKSEELDHDFKVSCDDYPKELLRVNSDNLKFRDILNVERHNRSHSSNTPNQVPELTPDEYENVEKICGHIKEQARTLDRELDSDVTDSSSDNESFDEDYNEPISLNDRPKLRNIPLRRRAVWHWLENRARIIHRLSWLQSQISDLELSIQDYSHEYRSLRDSRGKSTLDKNMGPTLTEPPMRNAVLNGYHGTLHCATGTVKTMDYKMDEDDCDSCSRTRGLDRSTFKKKKIVLLDLKLEEIKSNLLQMERCDCEPPDQCKLCGPNDVLDVRFRCDKNGKIHEKASSVQASYHPILFNPSEIPMNLRVDEVLRDRERTLKLLKQDSSTYRKLKNYKRNLKEGSSSNSHKIKLVNMRNVEFKKKRKYTRHAVKNNNCQVTDDEGSKNGKRKYSKTFSDDSSSVTCLRKYRRKKRRSTKVTVESGLDDSADEFVQLYQKDDFIDTLPDSPYSATAFKDSYRRKRETSYDIDNFVIPPSCAPASVVVKPQYKEILIPKWSIISGASKKDPIDMSQVPPEVWEDVMNDVTKVHEEQVMLERIKYRTNPRPDKNRTRKRTDSCPENSGTSTPDGASSPSLNLLEPSIMSDKSYMTSSDQVTNNYIPPLRQKRTNSICKMKPMFVPSDIENSNVFYEHSSSNEQGPYEERKFPLSDEAFDAILREKEESDKKYPTSFLQCSSNDENGRRTSIDELLDESEWDETIQ